MNRIITITPILFLFINLAYFIGCVVALVTSDGMSDGDCYAIWSNIIVASVFSFLGIIINCCILFGSHIYNSNDTDKYDSIILILQIILLLPCMIWSIYTYNKIPDRCYDYIQLWNFLQFSIIYEIILIILSIVMIIDKNIFCCLIIDSDNYELTKNVCCLIRRNRTGSLDNELYNFQELNVNEIV